MVLTRAMEANTNVVGSTSQTPFTAMEKYMQALMASIQELTRQHQVLMQRLLQHE